MKKAARQFHRFLAYLLFLQVFLWILGGVVFALLPFNGWVKGGDSVSLAEPAVLTTHQLQRLLDHGATPPDTSAIRAEQCAGGTLLALQTTSEELWLDPDSGRPAVRPAEEAVATFARRIYTGNGELESVRHLDKGEPYYLGLVDELYGRTDVWQARFDDFESTRIYLHGNTGCYLTVRNDYWVLFDALWRLHIMDYGSGEDFNNPLLRVFAISALLFVLSGMVLTALAARRALGRR